MAEKLTDEELAKLVDGEFQTAIGAPEGELSLERAEALDYYLRKPFGNEEEDGSKVITSDVEDVVDGLMPSLLRIFTTADNLVSFDPVGPEDEEQAKAASDYVNHIFFKKNPAFELLFFGMFDALVQKTGIYKAWWDESEEISTESYEGLSEMELLGFMDDEELEEVERTERKAETIDDSGQPVFNTVFDVEFRRVTKTGRVKVECVPPDEYRISNDSRSLNPSGARMVGHERDVTRDELLAMGFDKKVVDDLPVSGNENNSTEKTSRRDKTDDQTKSRKHRDKSQDMICLREAYIKADADGDGRAELLQVFTANGKLLSKEAADRQPFHMICPHPLPHKHVGRSSADKAMDIQLVNSTILRQTLENLYHSNRPRQGVWDQAMGDTTMDDLLTTKVGTVVQFTRPVNEAYTSMQVPFTAGQSFPMIEYFDKVKRDRAGLQTDGEGLTPDALKNIQQSVMAEANDMSRMKIETIARIFAETGFKTLFQHIHELVLKHQNKMEWAKLRNQWVPIDPTQWRHRRDMTVNIGLGIGTRDRNLVHLDAIWQKQMQMVEGGGLGLTVTPRNIWNTAKEIVNNANYKQPEMFFTDPGDKQAPPPSSEQEKLAQMQAELQHRQQQLDAQKQALDAQKLELDAQAQAIKHDREMRELERKYEKDRDDFFVENQKLKNDLTEMELKYGQNVPGSQV